MLNKTLTKLKKEEIFKRLVIQGETLEIGKFYGYYTHVGSVKYSHEDTAFLILYKEKEGRKHMWKKYSSSLKDMKKLSYFI